MKWRRELVTCLDDADDQYILNMREVGAILDLSRSTAMDYCARGIILGAFQVGRNWRIRAGELRKHIEGAEHGVMQT